MKKQLQTTEFRVQALMLAITLLMGFSIKAQYNYLGTYDGQGKPYYLESIRDNVSQAFLNDVDASLPESRPVPTYNPQYIAGGTETDICLKDSAGVWVTFVAEGAGYRNVLGFYTYDLANPPQTTADITNETIIFPNVSAQGSGGGLLAGDKVKIGDFSANTGIGWFLVANGWNGSSVGNGNWKVYSNPDFNPEPQAIDRFHNVLLNDSSNQRIVLGFEDIRRDYASCDQDFNDAIFYITANPYSAIQTDSINTISDATTTVSSGGNGGLESNGNLASKIAQRNYQRKKTKIVDYDAFQNLPSFDAQTIQKGTVKSFRRDKGVDQRLHELLPTQSLFNATAVVSTPTDLLDITNAKEVFAADYIANNTRKGAAMIMYTENNVYEHTKAVCDRLNGAELLSIKKVIINGNSFALFQLKQADGAVEYAVNFVVQNNGNGDYEVDNHWALQDYQGATNNYNFQFWSSTMAMTIKLVEDALANVAQRGNLIYNNQSVTLPSVYVKKGEYKAGKLFLTIQNNSKATQLELNGDISRTETSERELIQHTISLTGIQEEILELEVGNLFDIGFSLETMGTSTSPITADVLYTADGAWGTDYESEGADLSDFTINETTEANESDCHALERSIVSSGNVKNYVSFFKNLKAGGKATDISNYNALQFEGMSNQKIEVTVVKEGIQNWSEQFRTTIQIGTTTDKNTIFLADLKNASNESFSGKDVQSVVFSIKSDGEENKGFEIQIDKLAFVNEVYVARTNSNPLTIFPNPVNNQSVAELKLKNDGQALIQVYDISGKLIYTQEQMVKEGVNRLSLPQGLISGVYFYTIRIDDANFNDQFIVQ